MNTENLLQPVHTTEYEIIVQRKENLSHLQLKNLTDKVLSNSKIPVLEMKMPFAPETPVYGEGYNKLCQYSGTVSELKMCGSHGDAWHYKLPEPEGFFQVYNMILFTPANADALLAGFASCNRFSGEFWFNESEFKVILNLENIEIAPHAVLDLETLFVESGNKNELLDHFASAINDFHPMLPCEEVPTGWCSWLICGPNVTKQIIYDNLEAIQKNDLPLKYIQIDDGYQPYMGDWLATTDAFEGGIKKLCLDIKSRGFEPAMWVAPFIAEKNSALFTEHPDWFVKDESGEPLSADRVTFRGWRCAPWYMLDGTHPEARKYLTHVFRTMREEWKVTYFKLDANMWGAMPFGVRYDKTKTCVEAYRMGMQAVLEGAGYDSFLLGCNAPMWPSLGVVHGMRVTNDNSRHFETFKGLKRECFPRNWQNNRLWANDPDTVLLQNHNLHVFDAAGMAAPVSSNLTREEFLFNASYILASGGMVLSGDDITESTEQDCRDLKKLLPSISKAAVFEDADNNIGRTQLEDKELIFLFNQEDEGRDFSISLHNRVQLRDFWEEKDMGIYEAGTADFHLEARSALVLEAVNC